VVRRVGTMVMERLTTVPRRDGSQQTSQESQDLELSFVVKVESEATCDGFRFMVWVMVVRRRGVTMTIVMERLTIVPREGGPEQTSHKSQLGADFKLNSDLGLIQDINIYQLNCVSLMEAGDGIWVAFSDIKMIKQHCVSSRAKVHFAKENVGRN
jgi:hypothetical protein